MSRIRSLDLWLLALATLSAHGAKSQTVISDEVSCPKCAITTRDVLTIDPAPVGSLVGSTSATIAQDGRGRYWLKMGGEAAIFDEKGALVKKIQVAGSTPDRNLVVGSFFPIPGDSMLILENGRAAYYVLGPDAFTARTLSSRTRFGAAAILEWPNSVFVAPTVSVQPGGVRNLSPYGLMSLAGSESRALASFGVAESGGVTRASDGGVWAFAWAPYALEHWSATGELLGSVERKSATFPATSVADLGSGSPYPYAAQQDSTGLLWILIMVPLPRDSASPPGPPTYRTTIEVLDPAAGRLVASANLDVSRPTLLPGQRLAIVEPGPQHPVVRIVQLTLTRESR